MPCFSLELPAVLENRMRFHQQVDHRPGVAHRTELRTALASVGKMPTFYFLPSLRRRILFVLCSEPGPLLQCVAGVLHLSGAGLSRAKGGGLQHSAVMLLVQGSREASEISAG